MPSAFALATTSAAERLAGCARMKSDLLPVVFLDDVLGRGIIWASSAQAHVHVQWDVLSACQVDATCVHMLTPSQALPSAGRSAYARALARPFARAPADACKLATVGPYGRRRPLGPPAL